MINWIASNWHWLAAVFFAAFLAGFAAYAFTKLPLNSQIAAMKEWLKYAVALAEKELGSGTGQLKLRMVYDLFIQKFNWMAKLISFETFSQYVDEALVWLDEQLASNAAVATFVDSGKSTSENLESSDT